MTENELILKWQQEGDIKARNAVVMRHKGMISKIAYSYRAPAFSDSDDLINEGVLGAMQAVNTYDASKGANFLTHAVFYIRRAMITYMSGNYNGRVNLRHKSMSIRRILENAKDLDLSGSKAINAFSAQHNIPVKDILTFYHAGIVDNPIIDEGDEGRIGEFKHAALTKELEAVIIKADTVEKIIEILNVTCDQIDRAAVRARIDPDVQLQDLAAKEGVSRQTLQNRYHSTIALLKERLL
jgi:RNA polymerase sigma factor (sigma-70 family)